MTQNTDNYVGIPRSSKLSPDDVTSLLNLTSEGKYSLRAVGSEFGVSHETVRNLLKQSGLYEPGKSWGQKRKEIRTGIQTQKNSLHQTVYSLIDETLEKKLSEATWPERKTVEYFNSLTFITKYSHKPEDILKLFQLYESAEKDGIKLSLEKFQEKIGIWYPSIGDIFKRVNVKPMYGNHKLKSKKFLMAKDIEERLKEFVDQDVSPRDLSYFLNTPQHVVYRKLKKLGRKINYRGGKFTYRLASQIYHAQDMGFRKEEIGELLDIDQIRVKTILKRRLKLEPKIIDMLKTLFDDSNINIPYIQKA